MLFIVVSIYLLINKSQTLEWSCTNNKLTNISNDQFYEQCTITVEYRSIEENEKQTCTTHSLLTTTLPLYSFYSNYTMKVFRLNSCHLLTLNQLPFSLPPTIEYLDLSYNFLSAFTFSYPIPASIRYLRLDNNPTLININFDYQYLQQQQLIGLSLRHNQNIQLTSLPFYIRQLDLTDCNLQHSSMLLLLKTLTKLTHLSLADNQLKQLPILNRRIQLEFLNLSNNQLTFINNEWLHRSLKMFDLTYNRIQSLEFLSTLVNRSLQLSLHGNPLQCDCWLGLILNSSSLNIIDTTLLRCNSYSIYNISYSDLLCSYSQHCTSDCTCCDFEACDCHSICPSGCLCSYDISWSNHIIQCQQRNLFDMHIHLPDSITELNYENNNIDELRSVVFLGKTNLMKLNLAKNNIKNITHDVFCGASNLQEINLSYNYNLMFILSNINELFSCLKFLKHIILLKEQIYDDDDESLSDGWIIKSDQQLIHLIRIKPHLFSSVHLSISTTIPDPSIQLDFQSTSVLPVDYQQSLLSTKFFQQNQILFIIMFFLLLFILLFLLLLILLAICRRKLRQHMNSELYRQRLSHTYYHHHHNLHSSPIQMPNNNRTTGISDGLYEQLPSLSSDSEQPFLSNEKKTSTMKTHTPSLPPCPSKFRYCHQCCQYEKIPYSSTPNTLPTFLILHNQSSNPNNHEYSCELRQYLLANQLEKPVLLSCNNETNFVPTIVYPNVQK